MHRAEQLMEPVVGKQGCQEALQKDVGEPSVQLFVLKHLKDAEHAAPCRVAADDVL